MGDDSDDVWHPRPATDALALLYDRFAPALFRTACSLLGSAADAEDVVHDVFVAVARGRERLPAVADVRAYLFTALLRTVARHRLRPRPRMLATDVIDAREPVQR